MSAFLKHRPEKIIIIISDDKPMARLCESDEGVLLLKG